MGEMERKELQGDGDGGAGEEEEKRRLLEGMFVLDFDMLCATVAMQTQGLSAEKMGKGRAGREEEEDGGKFGGVQRMWEGGVFDCFEDRRIAIETACCPCYRFGKNMGRASLGPCFLQGAIYFSLTVATLFNLIAFCITKRRSFLFIFIGSIITIGTYLGYFRTRIRKQFNIRGSNSSLDDCMNHILCPCCSLCQESRTLEMNNVQNGVWRGRGDMICIGSSGEGAKAFPKLCQPPLIPTISPEPCNVERTMNGDDHS